LKIFYFIEYYDELVDAVMRVSTHHLFSFRCVGTRIGASSLILRTRTQAEGLPL